MVREVCDELVRLALDAAELDALRVAAGYAVIDLQADSPDEALVPLVCSADVRGPDPNDELFGVGLLASWPHALDTAAVFEALKRPARANFRGAYVGFLQEFARGLSSDALPAALAWLRTYADSTDRRLGLVRDAVVRLAARNLPQSLDALVEFAQARAAHHHSLYEEDDFDDHPDPFHDTDRRRALVYALIEAGSSDEVPSWLTDSSSANLVRPEDLGWVADCCAAAAPERRSAWVTLFRLAYRDDDRQHLDLVLDMDRTHPLYESVVADWVESVPLDSPAADQMRERWRQLHRSRRRADQPDQLTLEIERLLDLFDAGNPDAYWQAVHLLHVRPGTDRYNDEHVPDLTALPRWNQLSQQTREKLIAAAPRYLRSRLCHPDQWLGQPIMHHPSRAAYQAMVLLLRHWSTALDAISAEDWRQWAPAIIAWPVTVNGAQESDKKELVQHALPHSRNELAAALKVHLDGQLSLDPPANG